MHTESLNANLQSARSRVNAPEANGVHMHKLPDLTKDGAARLYCERVTVRPVKGSFHRAWDMVLRWDVPKDDALGILPDCLRGMRQSVLQAMDGQYPVQHTVEPKLECAVTLTMFAGGEVAGSAWVEDREAVLRSVKLKAHEGTARITYLLRVNAPADLAVGFVEAIGSDLYVQVKVLDERRQPNLFTERADLPKPDPNLFDEAPAAALESESELPPEPAEKPKRKPRRKAAVPVAEA